MKVRFWSLAAGMLFVGPAAFVAAQTTAAVGGPALLPRSTVSKSAGQPKNLTAPPGFVSGSVMGYSWNAVRGDLRPILGVPGASQLGASLDFDVRLRGAWTSPAKGFGLGLVDRTGQVVVLDLIAGGSTPIPDARPHPNRVFFSPTGRVAGLYYRLNRSIQVMEGLPDAPRVAAEISIADLPSVVTAMAVSDDGQRLLLATSQSDAGSVFVIDTTSAARLLAPVGTASDVRFLANSHAAVIADYGTNQIFWTDDVDSGTVSAVAAGEQGIAGPVGAAASRDGARLFVANSGNGTVTVLDLSRGSAVSLRCDCQLTDLADIDGGATYRLSPTTEGPLTLLVASRDEPRIAFVPVASTRQPGTEIDRKEAVPRGRQR